LRNKSNPKHAWGTHASRRIHTFISEKLANHSSTLKYQPLKRKNQLYHSNEYSQNSCLQLLSQIMTGTTKPSNRHQNNEVVMEEVTPPSKRNSPSTSKASHKKSKSNNTTISLYRDSSQIEFWYGYPVMETIAYEADIPRIPVNTPIDELIASGYVASEASELGSARMSFPRVQ
jgi:hypothetical protein